MSPLTSTAKAIRSASERSETSIRFQIFRTWPRGGRLYQKQRLSCDSYRCTLVMPLTVWRRDYFDELAAALRTLDNDLRCFRLTAAEQVLRARIIGRPTSDGPHDWCLAHIPPGLALMRDTAFGEEVTTDGRSPDQIAEAIVAALGGNNTETILANTIDPSDVPFDRSGGPTHR